MGQMIAGRIRKNAPIGATSTMIPTASPELNPAIAAKGPTSSSLIAVLDRYQNAPNREVSMPGKFGSSGGGGSGLALEGIADDV